MPATIEEKAKSYREDIVFARKNNNLAIRTEAEKRLHQLVETSDSVAVHYQAAMLTTSDWSIPQKKEDIPEKLIGLFQQHPLAVTELLLDDNVENGLLAKKYLRAIINNDAYRTLIDDPDLLSKVQHHLKPKVEL